MPGLGLGLGLGIDCPILGKPGYIRYTRSIERKKHPWVPAMRFPLGMTYFRLLCKMALRPWVRVGMGNSLPLILTYFDIQDCLKFPFFQCSILNL